MSKCFNKECDYCKDNECRFGIEDNAGCHWYIGEPLKEPLSKKFQDYAEEELPKLRGQIEQKDHRIAELEKRIEKLINKEISFYHSLLWKLWFSEKSPTQDELWELHTSYDPCYCCVECGYFDTIGEKCEICGSTRIELRESREEFEIDRLKELLYISNKDELIDRLLMQERQKVIAELEEWADENLTKLIKRGYFLPNNLRGLRLVEYEELNQKLNEMKGAE